MRTSRIRFAALVISAFAVSACDTEPDDWQTAEADGSVETYAAYLEAHPKGAHAVEATTLRDALLEGVAWDEARAANTEEAYAQYLESYEDGPHAAEAKVRSAGLGFASAQVTLSINAPEGAFMISSPFGAIEHYPPGTQLSMELRSSSTGGTESIVTVDAVYERMDDGRGRFVAANGVCLLLEPRAEAAIRCPDYDAPLPDSNDAGAVLLYTWLTDDD